MPLISAYQESARGASCGRLRSAVAVLAMLALLSGCAGRHMSGQPVGGAARPAAQASEWIDLLKTVPDGRAIAGKWAFEDGALAVDETPAARFAFPYRPSGDYDFLIEFTLSQTSGCVAQLVSNGETPFTWSMNAGKPPRCRLEDIGGHSVIGNPTLKPYEFVAGKRYTSLVSVRNDRVTCSIDGEVMVEFKTDYRDLGRNPKWEMPDQLSLGLGAWNGPMTFHRAAVREVPRLSAPR